MSRRAHLLLLLGLVTACLALTGCGRQAQPADQPAPDAAETTPAEEPPPADEVPAEEPPAEEPTTTDSTGEEPAGEPAAEEPAAGDSDSAEPSPTTAGDPAAGVTLDPNATLEGVLLTPRAGVKILRPSGWKDGQPDDGSLLKLTRREPVGGVLVNVTLDYSVDQSLPAGTTVDDLADGLAKALPSQTEGTKLKVVAINKVTAAGRPAVVLLCDVDVAPDQRFRQKQLIILDQKTFWTLSVTGPRDQFDGVVQPEFDAIAATLQLD